MITLSAPKPGVDRYIWWENALIGPFDQYGKSGFDLMSFEPGLSQINGSHGIFHENFVTHTKLSGELVYQPILTSFRANPTTQFPDQMSGTVLRYNGLLGERDIPLGLAAHHRTARNRLDNNVVAVSAYYNNPENPLGWEFYKIQVQNYYTLVVDWYVYRLVAINSVNSATGYANVTFETIQYNAIPFGKEYGIDWSQKQTFETVQSVFEGLTVQSKWSTTQDLPFWRPSLPPSWVYSPSAVARQVDVVGAKLEPGKLPFEPVPYGDLAMKAVENFDANHVNMLEFLRDIRHPTSMIPKLKNLKSLDSWADDYLAMKYAVLPTVSDIRRIVEAFHRRKPFLDRNGFTVQTAKSVLSGVNAEITYTLEQHVKVAIHREDAGLVSLMERLDSIGMFPTFENLWDLVPYSFVIDWLVDVGGFLERVDTRLKILRLNVKYATMSSKLYVNAEFPFSATSPYVGQLFWVHYNRWVSDQCPVPSLILNNPSQPLDHWLEGGALLKQRAARR